MDSSEIKLRVLTQDRRNKLTWNEDKMNKAAKEVANALKEIHDQKLWQVSDPPFASFEAYCQGKWGISRQRAYQIISAEGARRALADSTDDPSLREAAGRLNYRQTMEVAAAPEEKRVEVLKTAIEAPGKMTAKKIRAARLTVIPEPEIPEPDLGDEPNFDPGPVCEKCGQPLPPP